MRVSRDGETVGITLRVKVKTLAGCAEIANRANEINSKSGKRKKMVTEQDVIRHWLDKMPYIEARAKGEGK